MSSYSAIWGVCPHVRGVVAMSANLMIKESYSEVILSLGVGLLGL